MDYSKMSDFEINAAVFEALHGGAPDYKEGDGGAMVLISYEGDIVGGDAVEVEVERGAFNPCNNPADAWQIISANRISIEYDAETQCDVPVEWVTSYGIVGLKVHIVAHQPCDKALRAAMIVFLMMQDSANVPANSTGSDLR
ncbi:phage protein NinX family protein [Citrobacter freundii]|uniref:phage protein NinX family protein n=1 Tax=Citrobacter freundii TaxID=546 RepID=UPI0023B17528|nr:phage protein NinX family protein [Citrobacter freundii]